jgi:hypothetical protein
MPPPDQPAKAAKQHLPALSKWASVIASNIFHQISSAAAPSAKGTISHEINWICRIGCNGVSYGAFAG